MDKAFGISPSDRSAPAGGVAVLRCVIQSVPPARITWLRDGEPLPVNGSARLSADVAGQLSIRPVTHEDAGEYRSVLTPPPGAAAEVRSLLGERARTDAYYEIC